MTGVMIGVDPHKGSHTAVAVDAAETRLGQIRVIARGDQLERLRQWAQAWPDRTWAVEGAGGLGQLLAQQLLAGGERVVDVQPKLAARVRLLNTSAVNKNDPNDALSVAVAGMGPPLPQPGQPAHPSRVPAARRPVRTIPRRIQQAHLSGTSDPSPRRSHRARRRGPSPTPTRTRPGRGPQRIDAQRREVKRRTSRAVAAAPSSITEIYGVGPIVAAAVLGYVRDIRRFPTRDRFAAYHGTAPIEASSGRRTVHRLSRRGNRRLNHAIHMAAVTQISHHGTAGYAYYQRKLDEGMGRKAALRALKRKVSDTIYTRMITDTRRIVTPKGPGGHSGNDSASSATGSHPETPALRTSHSRADTHSRTADLLNEQVLTPRPAPDKRRPRRRGTGVTVEPRTSPLRGHGQERP
jgi:transposase